MEQLTACCLCNGSNIVPHKHFPYLSFCRDCCFTFANPRPTAREITDYYSHQEQYGHWISDTKGRELLWKWRFSFLLRFIESGTLLDVGAGIGEFLHRAKTAFSVSGTEISTSAIEYARANYALTFRQGAIETLDFGNETFDVITAFHVLEHVLDPRGFVKKIHSLLKKGGYFIIAVPNEIDAVSGKFVFWIKRALRIQKGAFRGIPEINLSNPNQEIHVSHFTMGSLSGLLERSGFEIVYSGLDRYYGGTGANRFRKNALYLLFLFIKMVTGRNYYETMALVCRKR